jgi:TldD protein
MTQEKKLDAALDAAAKAGVDYAEVRRVDRDQEWLTFKDGRLERGTRTDDAGVGIRVFVDGRVGFAAGPNADPDALKKLVDRAIQAARGSTPSDIPLVIPPPVQGTYQTPLKEDPFATDHGEKLDVMARAHAVLNADSRVKVARGNLVSMKKDTTLWATNGTRIDQSITLCGGGMSATAVDNDEVQTRSYPKGTEGNVVQAGFEFVREMDLEGAAERIRKEAIALCHAEDCPVGKRTLVLDGAQMSLQIHESVGHPTELDRAFGEEISLAGASFLLPSTRGELEYGTKLVNLSADSTTPRGLGTYGFDDEGTPATKTALVQDGRFVGYLSGRQSAARLGVESAGCLRAQSWSSLPIVRMVNVNLEPGAGTLDGLIGDIEDGLLFSVNKSWSIDDLRLNFQFACEAAYEIKGGKRTGRLFKNPVYFGVTPEFWKKCTAICGPEEWQMWGWIFCGKGDPIQSMTVGHGCAPARFDGVHIGNSRQSQAQEAA